MNDRQVRILEQSNIPQVRMMAAESYAQEGQFYKAAEIAFRLGYMGTAVEYALKGVENGDDNCTFVLVNAAPHLGNLPLESAILAADLRKHLNNPKVAKQYNDPDGMTPYTFDRVQQLSGRIKPGQVTLQFYMDLLKEMTLPHRVTVHSPNVTTDTDRPDLESRLPGLGSIEFPVYCRN